MTKGNYGKTVAGVVTMVIILTIGWVFSSIFSNTGNVDMFIVWLIFAAEGMKELFDGAWEGFFCIVGFFSFVVYAIYLVIRILAVEGKEFDSDGDFEDRGPWTKGEEGKFKRWGTPFRTLGIFCLSIAFGMGFLSAGIPNAKQAAVIYIIPKIINNADVQQIPANLMELLNEGLKDMLEDVKGDTKKVAKEAISAVKGEVVSAVSEGIKEGAQKVADEIKDKS